MSQTYPRGEDVSVQEFLLEKYKNDTTIDTSENIRMYRNESNIFDVVIINQFSKKAFSIYKTSDEMKGQWIFGLFRDKIPLLAQCVPKIRTSKVILEKVSKLICDNPLWTTAHIAAHLGYTECFRNKDIQSQVNIACKETGKAPLHIAVEAQQVESCKALVGLDVRMDCQDVNGNTPFHLAATTTKEIIEALTKKPAPPGINLLNRKGCTAINLACEAAKIECVIELLKAGVNIEANENNCSAVNPPSSLMKELFIKHGSPFSSHDMKYHGTPLHWSEDAGVTALLIEQGFKVNARNLQGDTALHVMVKRKRLDCAVMLLSHQADTDIQNSEGNTPLHLAVKSEGISLVEACIIFDGDLNILNNNGESPRHLAATEQKPDILYILHSVGANRCVDAKDSCNHGCSVDGQFNGNPPKNCAFSKTAQTLFEEILTPNGFDERVTDKKQCKVDSPKSVRILSLDGGGIRGLILIEMLAEIEKKMKKPIKTCFDLVAGTSTGGILALALATGKTMKECRCLYFRLKDKVFAGSRPYGDENLEIFLMKELGESTVMGDIVEPKIMITATRADRNPADLHIFRNYKSPLELLNHVEIDPIKNEALQNPRSEFLWKVARATGAAPSYFPPMGPYMDGGLFANNPSLDALTEIHQCNQARMKTGDIQEPNVIKILVSMGTGRPVLVATEPIEISIPDTFQDIVDALPNLLLNSYNLVSLLGDQATVADGRVAERAKAVCEMQSIPYFRLNPQLSENVGLNEKENSILLKMLWETKAYMRCMEKDIERLMNIL